MHLLQFFCQSSFAGAALALGCVCGGLTGGMISEKMGKKLVVISSNLVVMVLWISMSFATSAWLIIFIRFFTGVFCTSAFNCVGKHIFNINEQLRRLCFVAGVLISETADAKLRKTLGTFQAIAAILGFLLANITGLSEDWRMSAQILASVPLIASLSIIFFPETPFWLIKMGRKEDARYIKKMTNKC